MAYKKDTKNEFNKMKDKLKPQKGNQNKPFNFYWIYAIVGLVLISLNLFSFSGGTKKTTWNTFVNEMVKKGDVSRVVVVTNEMIAEIYIKPEKLSDEKYRDVRSRTFGQVVNPGPHYHLQIGSIEQFAQDFKELQKDIPAEYQIKEEYDPRKNWGTEILGWLIPIALMIGIWLFIMRRMSGSSGPGGQIFNIGKSKATLFDKEKSINVTFQDVAGLEEAKVEVQEIVDFLKNPKKYTNLGAKIPKGALLVGPPGTGKTLLAKAVAGEAQVPFFSLSGSDFVEMFVGVGASRVRDLFKQAKEKAPSIIFIDEIDAIGRARGRGIAQGANDERENTLNQLLTEMDGFGTNSGVIILAATNRADVLDRALVRAGRFDRQIFVDLPDLKERQEIFKVHLKPLKLDTSLDLDFLAKQTPGFSGADIANICNEAALIAARKNKKVVEHQDFLDAVDRIIGGLEKKNKIITTEEKKVIAYHEAGHATVSWLLEHASPLVKVTIVPRGRSLGAAWYLPEERQITTKLQLTDEICAALGGRASEEIIFNEISTGALSDLEKITKQAYAMITMYGLNEKIGNISFYDSSGQNDYSFQKPYSEKTAQLIDEEVHKFVEECYSKTKKLLLENKDKLDLLAKQLLVKEVIFKEDLEQIFGKRPFLTTEEKEAKEIIPTKETALNNNNESTQKIE
ncbi:cell division protease FtsH [Flavobacteriales bacterium]|nr:ATP-dependent zinc metalloprotease FtsH 3 [Flavobacteriales bacterium]GIK70637.1 MAG: ATP-dependent zinc metalloprotease FtsH [Bacteroidota bacterium]CAG0977980.1 cell division protease FtsH [Flavobacteriales bacterium]